MSSPKRRNSTLHEEPKEETSEVNLDPQSQMIESSTRRGGIRKPASISPVRQEYAVEAAGERSTRDEEPANSTGVMIVQEIHSTMGQDTAEPYVPTESNLVLERAPKTRGAVSPQLHNFLLYTVLLSTVFWGLLQVYQVAITSPCSFHPLLCPGGPMATSPDLSPWTGLLSTENDMFEHLLKDMVAGYGMSMDVKAAQMRITDLRTLVRGSCRSQKDLLVNDLDALLNEAKKSGKDLQTFATNIGQSFERIMTTNDWALQGIKRDTTPNEHLRVRGLPQKTVETSIPADFEEAMDILGQSLEVIGNDVESNSNNLRNIDRDLKAIMHSFKAPSDDVQESAVAHHPSKVGEPLMMKQFERCFQGLKDLESYADQATYVIGSAYSVIRDAKQQLETIRGRVYWERVAWLALNEKHIKAIAAGLENLEGKRVRARSAQEDMLTRKVQ